MTTLNLALIGWGRHASRNLWPYLKQVNNVKVVTICDVLASTRSVLDNIKHDTGIADNDIHLVESLAMELQPYDIHSLEPLKDYDLDAAIITTPPTKHYYQIKYCLELGLHIYVDKPFVLHYDHAQELTDLAKDKGLEIVVGSQRRYEDVYRIPKEEGYQKYVGEILDIYASISQPYDHLKGWWDDIRWSGGGVLSSMGWHLLDTIFYLTDLKFQSVQYAQLKRPENRRVEAYATSVIELENHTTATMNLNVGTPQEGADERLLITGSEGILRLSRFRTEFNKMPPSVTLQRLTGPKSGEIIPLDLSNAKANPAGPLEAFINLLKCFKSDYDCQQARRNILTYAIDSIETVRTVEAIYQNATTRVVHALPAIQSDESPYKRIAHQIPVFSKIDLDPNGTYLVFPQSVVVLGLNEKDEILLVKQYRSIVERDTFELPGGKVEKEEEHLKAAQRELREETGYMVQNLEFIMTLDMDFSVSQHTTHLFSGQLSQYIPHKEDTQLYFATLDKAIEMVSSGEISHAPTVAALFWLKGKIQ